MAQCQEEIQDLSPNPSASQESSPYFPGETLRSVMFSSPSYYVKFSFFILALDHPGTFLTRDGIGSCGVG